MPIATVYLDVIAPAMHEVGRLWHARAISVAQEHYVSACTQTNMSRLYPRIFSAKASGPTLLAACVEGELHEIGLRMVADTFQLAGWDTRFVGANTPATDFARMAVALEADLVALSAMTAAALPNLVAMVEHLRATPGWGPRPILVGGYPFRVDADLWRKVGADGSATDAKRAVGIARELMECRIG